MEENKVEEKRDSPSPIPRTLSAENLVTQQVFGKESDDVEQQEVKGKWYEMVIRKENEGKEAGVENYGSRE